LNNVSVVSMLQFLISIAFTAEVSDLSYRGCTILKELCASVNVCASILLPIR